MSAARRTDGGGSLPFGELRELQSVLEEQKRLTQDLSRRGVICPWVFNRDGKPIRSFKAAWEVACRAAGCPGLIPHDLRRTAVQNFERAGGPRRIRDADHWAQDRVGLSAIRYR